MLAEEVRRRRAAARTRLAALLARFPADDVKEPDRFTVRTELLVLAGLLESPQLLSRIKATYPPLPDSAYWMSRYGTALSDAAEALAMGEPDTAVTRLREGTAGDYKPFFWLPLVDLLFGLAFAEVGQVDSAVVHLEAAADLANLAISPFALGRLHLPLVLRRLAALEESRSNTDAAVRHYQRFLELWSDADPEVRDQVTSAQRALARLTGAETS